MTDMTTKYTNGIDHSHMPSETKELKQDAQVSLTHFSQGRLTVETQFTKANSPRDHSKSRKRSKTPSKKDKKKRSRSRSRHRRSRERSRKKYRRSSESSSRSSERHKKKKDKKHKKEKKKSKKSLEREEKRKMQARLAKARMLASFQQSDQQPGGRLEDDLDMPEIETETQAKQEEEVEETIVVIPPPVQDEIKIINKEETFFDKKQTEKIGKFQEFTEEKVQAQPVVEEEIEDGQIVEDNSKEVFNIGMSKDIQKKSKPNPFAAQAEDKESLFKSFSRFTAQPAEIQEEEDPFDAYMKQIQQDAVEQQNVYHPNQDQEFYEPEEENEEEQPEGNGNNVITMDELMQMNGEDETDTHSAVHEEDDFHSQFINELKKKEMVERAKLEGNQVIFNDEDDKFLLEFEKDEQEAESFLDKEKRRNDKKDIKLVSQQLEEYEPINKNLYIETKEIQKMTDKEVSEFRKNNGDIKVRGLKCPKPITNWYQCGLPDRVLEVIEKKEFVKPFPIQCQSIPAIMSGRDVIGIAETGSGKTLAYVLPMIRHIRDQRPLEENEGMIGLIMAPTRELAFQIYKESKSFAKSCGLRVVCVYGGANVAGQLSELKRGAEIVVCTPGRMIDVLTTSNGKITNLKRCSYIVLDEADRMLDMGFEPQISRVMQNVRPDKQCVMFSATFPRQIENLAKKILQSPIEIVVGNRGQTCANVEQFVEVMPQEDKFWRLMELLGEWYEKGSILIFVDKQLEADELFKELYKVGYKALVLHGGQDQTDREFTIQDFKDGVRSIMVATSICARGLDIKHIKVVINYICPNHLEDYVHRVGRTGRAGNKGTAYTFITPEECSYANDLIKALENSGGEVSEELRKLDEMYQQKVAEGEMDKRKSNIGFVGKGFEFNDQERQKVNQFRKELSKAYGMGVEEEDDDDNGDTVKSAQQREEERKLVEEQQVLQLLEKDPHARKSAMEAGNQASRNALKQGLSHEEATKVAQEAMLYVLRQYRPATVTMEKGLESVLSIRDQYIDKENEKNNIFTVEFEINDYPQQARGKVQSKDFLQSIYEMTGCKVLAKGTYFEFGRKPPTGQRRLYLYIEGSSRQEVANAYKEVKRFIEEASLSHQHANLNVGFSGQFTKI